MEVKRDGKDIFQINPSEYPEILRCARKYTMAGRNERRMDPILQLSPLKLTPTHTHTQAAIM